MERLYPDDRVRLKQDLPELGLSHDQAGIVCSTWFSPATAYEVEFEPVRGVGCPIRALLLANQVERFEDEGKPGAVER